MPSLRVLIVDDESEQRGLFRRTFEAHGLKACAVASGHEALELINSSARPDLILSDIAMPGMDGVSLIKALHSAPETASIPAILMSGQSLPKGLLDVAASALEIGPVFIKGGGLDALVSRVMSLLEAPAKRRILMDSIKRTVWIGDVLLPELPARRFQMLCALLRAPRGLSREELLSGVWEANDNLNVVDVTILRLRQDLAAFPFLHVETMPAGYRLHVDFPLRPN